MWGNVLRYLGEFVAIFGSALSFPYGVGEGKNNGRLSISPIAIQLVHWGVNWSFSSIHYALRSKHSKERVDNITLWFSQRASKTSFVNVPPIVDVPTITEGFNFCRCQDLFKSMIKAVYRFTFKHGHPRSFSVTIGSIICCFSLSVSFNSVGRLGLGKDNRRKKTHLYGRHQVAYRLMFVSERFLVIHHIFLTWLGD
jgi:hypothetical protein